MAIGKAATVDTLKQFLEAFNAHDLDAVMAFFADDCLMETPRGPHSWGRRYTGKDNVREGVAARFAGLPDVHYWKDRHFVSCDIGISGWTITGTTPDGNLL